MSEKKYTVDEVLLTFSSWQSMKARCSDKCNHRLDKKHYVEQGIKVCDEWKNDFKKFMKDLGPRPGIEYTLDRFPNKNGNYEPGNVRWATKTQQAINRKSTRLIVFNEKTQSLTEWAREANIDRGVLNRRLADGWSFEKALHTKVSEPVTKSFTDGLKKGKRLLLQQVEEIVFKAKTGQYRLTDLANEYKVSISTIYNILKKFGVDSKILKRYK